MPNVSLIDEDLFLRIQFNLTVNYWRLAMLYFVSVLLFANIHNQLYYIKEPPQVQCKLTCINLIQQNLWCQMCSFQGLMRIYCLESKSILQSSIGVNAMLYFESVQIPTIILRHRACPNAV